VPFRRVLTTLVERAPGARGAIFCDYEGESVELVLRDARLSEYDMKVFGAQLAAAWLDPEADSSECGAGGILELRLWCAEGTLLCRSLREGYYVVLLVAKGAPSGPAGFLLRNAAGEMSREI
jgi:predicted regulator of Ras-like GTPase activity (Roadblock/LC7/MglB family)